MQDFFERASLSVMGLTADVTHQITDLTLKLQYIRSGFLSLTPVQHFKQDDLKCCE